MDLFRFSDFMPQYRFIRESVPVGMLAVQSVRSLPIFCACCLYGHGRKVAFLTEDMGRYNGFLNTR